MSEHGNVIVRFANVTFGYNEKQPLMEDVNFSIRENAKVTLMGQNGAGKSTIFKMILGDIKPLKGEIHIKQGAKIGIAKQVMDRSFLDLTVEEYFATAFIEAPRNLPVLIDQALEAVNYPLDHTLKLNRLSGGQQARLLLAYALIQKPDILLLDEPTNNLDEDGIGHLITFLMMYEKTVIVISHDADFLNTFTDSVIYLDAQKKEIDSYQGDYYDVVEQIKSRIEAEERKNAQLLKNIQDRKEKVNFFSNKGGKMRALAAKLREEIEEDEANLVSVKQDDKTITRFEIEATSYKEPLVEISSVSVWHHGEALHVPVELKLRRGDRLFLKGPNGIGKTTLLKRLAKREEEGAKIPADVIIGYYEQDFSGLDFSQTAFQSLASLLDIPDDELVYATAARFLLRGDVLRNQIGSLSEGQKALLCFARFVLQKPNLLILDEPTNHVNFRHLPVIAEAIEAYKGTIIMVSHDQEFVKQVHFNNEFDLGSMRKKYLEHKKDSE